jgi:hypothetical protein
VVTGAVASTGAAADEHLLAEVLWQHHRLSRLGIPEAVADSKYGTTFNFLYLGRLGIPAFIPLTRFGVMRKWHGKAGPSRDMHVKCCQKESGLEAQRGDRHEEG